MVKAKNTICLWYDRDAEQAARFTPRPFPIHPLGRRTAHREIFHPGRKGVF